MKGRLRAILIIGASVLLQGWNLYAHESGSGQPRGNSSDQMIRSAVAGFIEWFERYMTPSTPTKQSGKETEMTANPVQGRSPEGTWYGIGYETRMKLGAGSGGGAREGSHGVREDGC